MNEKQITTDELTPVFVSFRAFRGHPSETLKSPLTVRLKSRVAQPTGGWAAQPQEAAGKTLNIKKLARAMTGKRL